MRNGVIGHAEIHGVGRYIQLNMITSGHIELLRTKDRHFS